MNKELVDALRRRIASTSVGPSTARNMGPKGTVAAARSHLANVDLGQFAVPNQRSFRAALDRATEDLVRGLPEGARRWGPARKFLNIFLMGAVYHRYLCKAHSLDSIEPWLELPLDSHVAKGLRLEPGGKALPSWKSVIGLDMRTHDRFQDFALDVASRKGIHRVHLDLIYWRGQHLADNKGVKG